MYRLLTTQKIMSLASLSTLVLFILLGFFSEAPAGNYRYIDKNGRIHFTDRLESVPKEYRDQIQQEMKPPIPSSEEKKGWEVVNPQATNEAPSNDASKKGIQKE